MFVCHRSKNSNDENLLDVLLARLAPLVAAELAKRDALPVYSTEAGMWPPGVRNARSAKRRIVQVPEHERVGAGVYRCTRAAYHAHYARRPQRLAVAPLHEPSDTDIAARALEMAGLRPTREVA